MYCTNGVKQLLLNVVYTLIRETGKLPERRAQTQSFILQTELLSISGRAH